MSAFLILGNWPSSIRAFAQCGSSLMLQVEGVLCISHCCCSSFLSLANAPTCTHTHAHSYTQLTCTPILFSLSGCAMSFSNLDLIAIATFNFFGNNDRFKKWLVEKNAPVQIYLQIKRPRNNKAAINKSRFKPYFDSSLAPDLCLVCCTAKAWSRIRA